MVLWCGLKTKKFSSIYRAKNLKNNLKKPMLALLPPILPSVLYQLILDD